LVVSAQPNSYVYLGLQEFVTPDYFAKVLKIKDMDAIRNCLVKYHPKPGDYISIPTGCVHAVGPGILLIEPQRVLPGKSGKTFRLFDWSRTYDDAGQKCTFGQPRTLHQDAALSVIDWSLPQGNEILRALVIPRSDGVFLGNRHNPFAMRLFTEPGFYEVPALLPHQFLLATVVYGKVLLRPMSRRVDVTEIYAGSAFLAADIDLWSFEVKPFLGHRPFAAVFALNLDFIGAVSHDTK